MSNVTIPRYSENLEFVGVVKAGKVEVVPDGSIKVDRLWAGFWSGGTCRSFLKSGSAVLERALKGISTNDKTELRMSGLHLVTESLSGNLESLEFQSKAGYELECRAPGEATPEVLGPRRGNMSRRPSWKTGLGVRQRGRGPLAEPRSTGSPYWFDGRIDRCFEFFKESADEQQPASRSARMLAKGPGTFLMNSGDISSRGGVLIRLPTGIIACGDGFSASWDKGAHLPAEKASTLMPRDLRKLRAGGGCQIRLTNKDGKRYVISCEEVTYSGKTGLVSLGGRFPRIDSSEGYLVANEEHQFLRITPEGSLKLGPGIWLSEQDL